MISSKPFIKISGITRPEDAILANTLAVNAIGFIFYPESKRFLTFGLAAKIARSLHAHCEQLGEQRITSIAGIFIDPTLEMIKDATSNVKLDILQMHGKESPEWIKVIRKEFPNYKLIKAIRLSSPESELEYDVDYMMIDHPIPEWGEVGKTVDWNLAKKFIEKSKLPVILSGGLHSENVTEAIHTTHAFGVDIRFTSEEKLKDLLLNIRTPF